MWMMEVWVYWFGMEISHFLSLYLYTISQGHSVALLIRSNQKPIIFFVKGNTNRFACITIISFSVQNGALRHYWTKLQRFLGSPNDCTLKPIELYTNFSAEKIGFRDPFSIAAQSSTNIEAIIIFIIFEYVVRVDCGRNTYVCSVCLLQAAYAVFSAISAFLFFQYLSWHRSETNIELFIKLNRNQCPYAFQQSIPMLDLEDAIRFRTTQSLCSVTRKKIKLNFHLFASLSALAVDSWLNRIEAKWMKMKWNVVDFEKPDFWEIAI